MRLKITQIVTIFLFASTYLIGAVVIQRVQQTRTCGTSSLRQKRIIGGYDTVQHQFPWQSAIRWRIGITAGQHICGGSLISTKFVLTAAHCFKHGTDTSYYNVTLGDHSSSVISGREQVRRIKNILIHPNYNTRTKDSDVALVELEKDVVLNDYVNTICLPTFADFEVPGKVCTITGWGHVLPDVARASITLKQANVPIIRNGVCNHDRSYDGKVTGNMFCAGHANGSIDACSGDSGGPLQCFSSNNGRWLLNGITSWGDGCGQQYKYGVYVRVRHFLTWIAEKLGGNKTPPTPPIPATSPNPGTPPIPPTPKSPPNPGTPPIPPTPKSAPNPGTPPIPPTPRSPLIPGTPPIQPTPKSRNRISRARREFLKRLRKLRKRALEKLHKQILQRKSKHNFKQTGL